MGEFAAMGLSAEAGGEKESRMDINVLLIAVIMICAAYISRAR